MNPLWIKERAGGSCVWTSAGRRHYRHDLHPYVCLAESCAAERPAFSSYQEWNRHLRGEGGHGQAGLHSETWPDLVHQGSQWLCQGLHDSASTYAFSSKQELQDHIAVYHVHLTPSELQKLLAEPSTEDISSGSRAKQAILAEENNTPQDPAHLSRLVDNYTTNLPRPISACLLCRFTPIPTNAVEARANDPPRSTHESLGKTCSGPQMQDLSRHVADHLETIMLLSLSLMSLVDEKFEGEESDSCTTGNVQDTTSQQSSGAWR
ncbi:hypothetical protein RB601_005431 [Gaeumannomyces tritici]